MLLKPVINYAHVKNDNQENFWHIRGDADFLISADECSITKALNNLKTNKSIKEGQS